MQKHRVPKLVIAASMMAAASYANAATTAIGTATAPTAGASATSPATLPVTFTGDGATVGFQVRINYDTANFDAAVVAANGATCSNVDAAGQITIIANDPSSNPLATGTYCNVTFTTAAGGAAVGVYPLDVNTAGVGDGCFDASLNPTTCNTTDGSITVAAVSSPTAIYNPAADADGMTDATAEIVFGPGGTGTTANSSVAVSETGGTAGETTTISGCAVSGTGLALVGAPNIVLTGGGSVTGNLTVSCTYGAAPRTGTLTCNETKTTPAGTTPRLWDISCPVGTATPPTVTYNPANGGTATATGNGGTTGTATVTATQSTAGQAGSSVVIDQCAATGVFTYTGPATTTFTGGSIGAPASLTSTCTIPLTPPNTTGTLTCRQTVSDGVTPVVTNPSWNLVCQAASPTFSSSPAPGGTLALQGPPSTTASGNISVTNSGNATLTTSCSTMSAGYTVNGAGAASLAPGASGNIAVTCATPATASTSLAPGTVTCTTNDPARATVNFTVTCTALSTSIPTLSNMGKLLLGALVLGLGMLGFALRRQNA